MEEVVLLDVDQVRSSSSIGCDVHRDTLVCVSLQLQENEKWLMTKNTFPNRYDAYQDLVNWCKKFTPEVIIMESTGVYWMNPYDALEEEGLPVFIVNPAHVKRMNGRKTDMEDARWLAQVGVNDSFKKSLIPTQEYRHLRAFSRNLTKQIQVLQGFKNRETKIFVMAGFNLSVFSDQFGKAAMIAKEAILAGKSAEEIAIIVKKLASKRIRATIAQLTEAFHGRLTPTLRNTIESNRHLIEALEKEIQANKEFIFSEAKKLDGVFFKFLQTIPGVSELSAAMILFECGGAKKFLEAFNTANAFAAWLGLCPGNNESASKKTGRKGRKGNIYLRRILCECAQAGAKTKGTTLSSKYSSLVIRLGVKRSIFALAHKLAKYIFFVITHQVVYRDPKIDYQKKSCEKNMVRWIKQLLSCEDLEVQIKSKSTGKDVISSLFQKKQLA